MDMKNLSTNNIIAFSFSVVATLSSVTTTEPGLVLPIIMIRDLDFYIRLLPARIDQPRW